MKAAAAAGSGAEVRASALWCGTALRPLTDRSAKLTAILRDLADDRQRQISLGQFARTMVVERHSLDVAAQIQLDAYARAIETHCATSTTDLLADAARAGAGMARYKALRKWQRWRGTAPVDDFNTVARMRQVARPQHV